MHIWLGWNFTMSPLNFTAYKQVLPLYLEKAATHVRKASMIEVSKRNGIKFYHSAPL